MLSRPLPFNSGLLRQVFYGGTCRILRMMDPQGQAMTLREHMFYCIEGQQSLQGVCVRTPGPFHFPNNADITAHPELVEGPPTGGSTSSPRTGFPEISKNEKALVRTQRIIAKPLLLSHGEERKVFPAWVRFLAALRMTGDHTDFAIVLLERRVFRSYGSGRVFRAAETVSGTDRHCQGFPGFLLSPE